MKRVIPLSVQEAINDCEACDSSYFSVDYWGLN